MIVEDEVKVVDFLTKGLTEQGFDVDSAYDGEMGKRLAQNNYYDVILLDLIIPHINGYDLCKLIRQDNQNTIIIMLTALGTTDDKVTGFDSGANDYLVKPFEFRELLARIKALTKRAQQVVSENNKLVASDLILDLSTKTAFRGTKTIQLTAKEFMLLEYLMRNKDKVLSRPEIAEKVWEITFDTGTNVVDVYINILRKKIDRDFEEKLIQTRVGLGYSISTR